ncbi:outer membrane protein [Rickettsia endosymbiont of Culicoides newsteadi]|uniref:outer membrane protein n=1 Tax=Rickettsia endosymbiont of Culicoides newsteadi TaxID=1961830 RepID=UPI000B9B8BC8|nr:hypothetical protein [Rickettsia endosymbiont of Culicoides newsteadi]OZG31916.1 adhesin [Rickettsia endosymbiont of Culicoides newsteadi]
MHSQKIHSYTTSTSHIQYLCRVFITKIVGYYGRDAPTAANFVPLQKYSSVNRKANNFAYQLIAGVSVSLNEKARIDVAYILADYGQTKFSKCNDVEINKTSYQTHNIIAGLRFDI